MIFKLICDQGKIGEGEEDKRKSEKQVLGRKCFSENSLLWDRTGCVDNGKKGRGEAEVKGMEKEQRLFKDMFMVGTLNLKIYIYY